MRFGVCCAFWDFWDVRARALKCRFCSSYDLPHPSLVNPTKTPDLKHLKLCPETRCLDRVGMWSRSTTAIGMTEVIAGCSVRSVELEDVIVLVVVVVVVVVEGSAAPGVVVVAAADAVTVGSRSNSRNGSSAEATTAGATTAEATTAEATTAEAKIAEATIVVVMIVGATTLLEGPS